MSISYYTNNDSQRYKTSKSTSTSRSNKPAFHLKVKYVDKVGQFCQKCILDRLQSELAEKISKEDVLNV